MSKQNLEPLISTVFEKILPEKVDEVLNNKKLGYFKLNFIYFISKAILDQLLTRNVQQIKL